MGKKIIRRKNQNSTKPHSERNSNNKNGGNSKNNKPKILDKYLPKINAIGSSIFRGLKNIFNKIPKINILGIIVCLLCSIAMVVVVLYLIYRLIPNEGVVSVELDNIPCF